MEIKVLSLEGMDAARAGWRFSRDVGREVDASEVAFVDVPVCELPTCHLLMTGMTIIEREIVASMRSHVIWARTSHVDDPLLFEVPEEFRRPSNEVNRQRMAEDRAAGLSQDEWRAHLPVTSTTAWTQRISYRDLVKLTVYLTRLSQRTGEILPALRSRFLRLATRLTEIVDQFTGGQQATAKAIGTFQEVSFLHERATMSSRGSVAAGEFVVVTADVPLWLRAQIVRHRPLAVVDTFFSDVLARHDSLELTISEPVTMELAASRSYWQSILSKRSCWLAQDQLRDRKDPWQEIIDSFGGAVLPCASGVCPYERDAALRLTDADPGVPCPRYCNIHGVDKAPYRAAMLEAARSRSPSWLKEIEA